MRIGIDCRTILNPELGEKAGIGHYTYYLLRNLLALDKQNEYVLFFTHRLNPFKEFEQPNVEMRVFPFAMYKKFLPFTYSHMLITAALMRARLDVYHSPANVIPLSYTGRSVVTIHDLAIYKNPEWFPSQVFSTKLLVPQSVKKAKKVIAVSQSTAEDLKDIFNVPLSKISVIHEGVTIEYLDLKDRRLDVRKKYNLPKYYLLFVGTIEPRKNLLAFIKVFAEARKLINAKYSNIQLILAGATGHRSKEVFALIRNLRLKKYVRHIGYVSQNEKYNLMKQAWAFVFPSLYEGFGLPVLEAMKLGSPVLTGNKSSMPEVAGDSALLVNPQDEQAMFKALIRIIQEPALRARLKKDGKKRAENFSWKKTAKETLKVYEAVAKKKK
ncbi:MAG: glycosyltransferase family 1 protein [Patescibacteria group bacterium]